MIDHRLNEIILKEGLYAILFSKATNHYFLKLRKQSQFSFFKFIYWLIFRE